MPNPASTELPNSPGYLSDAQRHLPPVARGDLFFVQIPQQPGQIKHRAEPHDEMLRDFIRRIALPVLLDISQITGTAILVILPS
jgi:hypothetical protein